MPCPASPAATTKVADVHVGGQRRLLTYATAVDAVSATLMSNQLSGEYAYTEDGVIRTSWVFTAPTRRYTCEATSAAVCPAMGQCIGKRLRGAEFDMSFDREGLGEPMMIFRRDRSSRMKGVFPRQRCCHLKSGQRSAV